MPLGLDYATQDCSLARSLEMVGERWTLLILRDCFFGVRRFSDFQHHLGISKAVLTDRLAGLVDDGLLVRTPQGGREEYTLLGEWTRIVLFWPLTLIGMAIERCESVPQFLALWDAQSLERTERAARGFGDLLFYTWPLVVMQLAQHFSRDLLVVMRLPAAVRGLLIGALVLAMLVFGVRVPVEFFYFQF